MARQLIGSLLALACCLPLEVAAKPPPAARLATRPSSPAALVLLPDLDAVRAQGWVPQKLERPGARAEAPVGFDGLCAGRDRAGSQGWRELSLASPWRRPPGGKQPMPHGRAWTLPAPPHGVLLLPVSGNHEPVAARWWTPSLPGSPRVLELLYERSDYGNKGGALDRTLRLLLATAGGRFRHLLELPVYSEEDWDCRASAPLARTDAALVIGKARETRSPRARSCARVIPGPERIPLTWLLADHFRSGVRLADLPPEPRAALPSSWIVSPHTVSPRGFGEDLNLDGELEWVFTTHGVVSVMARIEGRWQWVLSEDAHGWQAQGEPKGGWRPLRLWRGLGSTGLERVYRFREGRYR